MPTLKCRFCGAEGVSFCTHGKYAKKKFIEHKKGCRTTKPRFRRGKQR